MPIPVHGPWQLFSVFSCVSLFHLGLTFSGSRSFYQPWTKMGSVFGMDMALMKSSFILCILFKQQTHQESMRVLCFRLYSVSKGKTEAKGLDTGITLFLNVMVTLVFSIVSFPNAHLGQITSYLFTVSFINLGPLLYLFNPLSRSLRYQGWMEM